MKLTKVYRESTLGMATMYEEEDKKIRMALLHSDKAQETLLYFADINSAIFHHNMIQYFLEEWKKNNPEQKGKIPEFRKIDLT